MTIIVTRRIKKRELRDFESGETKTIFTKLKQTLATAVLLSAPELPPGSTLHKVYATSSGGARRLLFLWRHQAATATERWVLLFYRKKGDEIGDNMSAKNPLVTPALLKTSNWPLMTSRTARQLNRSLRNTETAALPVHW